MSPLEAGIVGFVIGGLVGFLGCCLLVANDRAPTP